MHGKISAAEKEEIMTSFKSGKKKILVSTTVIEVGIDVPEATVMIIENAERFGLSQLHQLRGRVGRGMENSYCILLHGIKLSAEAKKRLAVMKKFSSGFDVAQHDLSIRGAGDYIGVKQSGEASFNFFDILADADKLHEIDKEIKKISLDTNKEHVDLLLSMFNKKFYFHDGKVQLV